MMIYIVVGTSPVLIYLKVQTTARFIFYIAFIVLVAVIS